MDKQQISLAIKNMLNSSTVSDATVSFRDDTHIELIVISDEFQGKTYSARFRLLDSLIKSNLEDIHQKFFFKFQAFTKEEAHQISLSGEHDKSSSNKFKISAKDL